MAYVIVFQRQASPKFLSARARVNGISPEKTYFADVRLVPAVASPEYLISDILLKIRDYLDATLTDPKANDRASESPKTAFVMTSWPEREVYYPHVIVEQIGGNGDRYAGNSHKFRYELVIGVQVMSKSTTLTDKIVNQALYQMWAGLPTFSAFGMHFMKLLTGPRPIPMADPHVRRKDLEYSFHVYVTN